MVTATSETVIPDTQSTQAQATQVSQLTQLDEVLQAVENSQFINADELSVTNNEAAASVQMPDSTHNKTGQVETASVDTAHVSVNQSVAQTQVGQATETAALELEASQLIDAGEKQGNSVQTLELKPIEMIQTPQVDVASQASIQGSIPMEHGLILAGIIFAIGLCGVMVRRNFLFMLMSLEIMMSAAALAFIVAGSHWLTADGQVMFVFILTLAAAEASLGLAILLQFYHRRGHLDVDTANEMRG